MTVFRGGKLVYSLAHHPMRGHSADCLIKGDLRLEVIAVVGPNASPHDPACLATSIAGLTFRCWLTCKHSGTDLHQKTSIQDTELQAEWIPAAQLLNDDDLLEFVIWVNSAAHHVLMVKPLGEAEYLLRHISMFTTLRPASLLGVGDVYCLPNVSLADDISVQIVT